MTGDGVPAALVTGGSGRIGRAVVAALAARGWAVAVHCHAALAAARELAATIGRDSLAVTADLREEGAVRALVHRVADHFGRLDVVVHCARRGKPGPFEDLATSDLRTHCDVNLGGPFVVAQEAGLVMVQQPTGGTIVLVGDPPGPPEPGDLAAFTSRSALPGLAQALAAEFAARNPRVRVAFLAAAGADAAATAAAVVALVGGEPGGSAVNLGPRAAGA